MKVREWNRCDCCGYEHAPEMHEVKTGGGRVLMCGVCYGTTIGLRLLDPGASDRGMMVLLAQVANLLWAKLAPDKDAQP